ncbi:MAG TPA: hypothetical protein VIM14_14430 [Polyangia bacterium]
MAETIDEITYDYEDEGVLVRKQLDKVVLTKGAWSTLMFLYQELDKATGGFRSPKIAIVRFKKFKGSYRKQSSFNVSSEKQARQITEVFEGWYAKMGEAVEAAEAAETTETDDAPDSGDAET